MSKGDQISVGAHGAPRIIDLETGEVRGKGSAPRPLSAAVLADMRAAAVVLRGMGNQRIRTSQFMMGEIHFQTTLGGQTTTLAFVGEGHRLDEPMETVWQVAFGRS